MVDLRQQETMRDEDTNPTGEACGAEARLTSRCERGIGHPGDHRDEAGNEWPKVEDPDVW